MRTRKDMASFPNVWPYAEPSVSTEGVRTDRRRLATVASRIASALSELATLPGRSGMRSTHELLTGTLFAPHHALVPVRARATRSMHDRWVA